MPNEFEWRCPGCCSVRFSPAVYDQVRDELVEDELQHCNDCGTIFEQAVELRELEPVMV